VLPLLLLLLSLPLLLLVSPGMHRHLAAVK
jgi:hypothetical protein